VPLIQQRIEVDRSLMSVYDALARPQFILESLPGVIGVRHVSEDVYHITAMHAGAPRDVELHLTAKTPPRHIEWRTADGIWSGTIDLEMSAAERTTVSVSADRGATAEAAPADASAAHEILQSVKRALQPGYGYAASGDYAGGSFGTGTARRYASEWRETAQSAFARPAEFPFKLARTLSHQMERLLGDVWRAAPMQRLPQLVPGFPWNPDVEVSEREGEVRVCIDVPGVDESHLQVEIHEGTLTVRGERQDERGADAGRRRSELHYGSFVRRIPLPEGVDADAAEARLRNGVLEIRMPMHRREPRRIPVQPTS
jgi:HSP20 family protein